MRVILLFNVALMLLLCTYSQSKAQGSNAAPSEHLVYSFPSDAVIKMHKVKIVKTAYTSYFSVFNWSGGYAGLQDTPDSSSGSSKILIASQWDPNTSGGIYATAPYIGTNTIYSRFGGEGDGAKTINPYNWELNTWYNFVIRSWKLNGNLYIATFIQNLTSQQWFHTSTLAIPERTTYLGSGSGAFLENWHGSDPRFDGRFERKAFFKDCWNRNTSGVWQKSTSRYFSANANDAYRNGIYDTAFNAGYDSSEDAYFMEHGGNVTPSAAFNGGRVLTLPDQTNQGSSPTLTVGQISSVAASYASGNITVNWVNDNTLSPQFSSLVEILDASNNVVSSITETLPQKRSATLSNNLSTGTYTARVTITDIFGGVSDPVSSSFTVSGGGLSGNWYKIKNAYSGKYLGIENSGTANLAKIAQYTNSSSANLEWKFEPANGVYTIINRNSNKAIDIANSDQTAGAEIIQYTITSGLNQQWDLVPTGNGNYLIQSNMSSHYIIDNPASSTADGTRMIIYPLNGSTGTTNQQWVLEEQSGSSARIAGTVKIPGVTGSENEQHPRTKIQVAPNPANQYIIIQNASVGKEISIYNMGGSFILGQLADQDNTRIDINRLSPGMYLLLHNGKQLRFVKQ
ncbi:hypothetical protein COR50_17045 [Chitinophaga caeni]|uniref:Uncharacterized protein n=1 Tax=Chitinophaga caeni TaxID=2029983 RepID=A0A291QXX6_9BACT|nr:RICIN domain-containing protein [Chitinophaga caeni]ATL48732.1 hypothetical protein COR50_17045 [Chitinophaga caeni]